MKIIPSFSESDKGLIVYAVKKKPNESTVSMPLRSNFPQSESSLFFLHTRLAVMSYSEFRNMQC